MKIRKKNLKYLKLKKIHASKKRNKWAKVTLSNHQIKLFNLVQTFLFDLNLSSKYEFLESILKSLIRIQTKSLNQTFFV